MNPRPWEIVLFALSVAGSCGSVAAVTATWGDLQWIEAESPNGRRPRRILVAKGYVRDAVVAFLVQLAVLVIAGVYVTQPPLTRIPTPLSVWVIRGTIIAVEVLLLVQMWLRHRDRVRLVAMIRAGENHYEGEKG